MKNLIFELAKIDRRAALIFNREIKLRIKRGELKYKFLFLPIPTNVSELLVYFRWCETRQGWEYWGNIHELFI